jgi:hypothetical protein
MPALFVRILALVEPTPNVSTTQAPAVTGTDVVMMFADVLLFAKPIGSVCETPLSEMAFPRILLLSDCEIANVTCTV